MCPTVTVVFKKNTVSLYAGSTVPSENDGNGYT